MRTRRSGWWGRTARLVWIALVVVALGAPLGAPASAASGPLQPYDIGAPTLLDVWVDPLTGDDGNGGESRELALRTLNEAWNRIPQGTEL